MMQGAPDSPAEVRPGSNGRFHSTMSDTEKDIERGEKRGVLSTGRANKLGKTKTTEDADADAAADDEEDEEDDVEG